MRIFNYNNFITESFLSSDKSKAIKLILDFLEKKTQIKFYPYDELWNIQKGNIFLKGSLYICLQSNKALRFNWIENDLRSQIHSIDIWTQFEFDSNPEYTLELGPTSITTASPDIVEFYNNAKSLVENIKGELTLTEDLEVTEEPYDPKKRLDMEIAKLKRLRNPEKIELQTRKIERLKVVISSIERAQTESEKINQLDDELQIEVFKSIELYTNQVASGKSNSLIVTGDSGVGKTQTIRDTLDYLGLVKDKDYYIATGTATTVPLYELLFKHKNKLLIFDDCDSVFKEADSVNILKGALDTYPVRELSKLTKGTTFDSIGMSEKEMDDEFLKSGKYPNKFDFKGQVIFISNLSESKFDKALLSRSLHVDVHLNKQELFERMKNIMKRISPDVDYNKKLEALDYLNFICNNYPTKFDLNIRTLIHSINLRSHNEDTIQVGEKQEPIWKLLIKKYLVKSR